MKKMTLSALTLAVMAIFTPQLAIAGTAKQNALDYCKKQESPGEYVDSIESIGSNTWYGKEPMKYITWDDCVREETKHFAEQADEKKKEYKPTEQDKAYATKYCSASHTNSDGKVWYGRAAEASQPIRHLTNANVFLTQESCIESKTRESYYGATPTQDIQGPTPEERAKTYCQLYEYDSPNHAVKHNRHFGPIAGAYSTEQACLEKETKRFADEDAKAKALEGKIMQPWQQGATVASATAPAKNGGSFDLESLKNGSNANVSADCAIWLCLPAGFPSPYCDAAKKAFKHRVKRGKSPLPPFNQCAVDDNGQPLQGNAPNGSNAGTAEAPFSVRMSKVYKYTNANGKEVIRGGFPLKNFCETHGCTFGTRYTTTDQNGKKSSYIDFDGKK